MQSNERDSLCLWSGREDLYKFDDYEQLFKSMKKMAIGTITAQNNPSLCLSMARTQMEQAEDGSDKVTFFHFSFNKSKGYIL